MQRIHFVLRLPTCSQPDADICAYTFCRQNAMCNISIGSGVRANAGSKRLDHIPSVILRPPSGENAQPCPYRLDRTPPDLTTRHADDPMDTAGPTAPGGASNLRPDHIQRVTDDRAVFPTLLSSFNIYPLHPTAG